MVLVVVGFEVFQFGEGCFPVLEDVGVVLMVCAVLFRFADVAADVLQDERFSSV